MSPLIFLLFLPHLGDDERQDQQPDDDGDHAQGQRQTQRPVDGVVAEFSPVAQMTVAHQTGAAARRRNAVAVVVALSHLTGGQAEVDASWLEVRKRGVHCRRWSGGNKTRSKEFNPGVLKTYAVESKFPGVGV